MRGEGVEIDRPTGRRTNQREKGERTRERARKVFRKRGLMWSSFFSVPTSRRSKAKLEINR